ncbi:MAG: hypothetical protein KAX05_16550 [Bacteroidales bacterium]|nr:hypothetical protein [Bacteroidales bacterium]
MDINRQNFETYFIDYLDGRLDPGQVAELLSFLGKNPDLERELKEFENIQIKPREILFPGKESLRKTISDIPVINESNFEEYCIAKIEGDLRAKDEVILEQYLADFPGKRKDFELFAKTILQPDTIFFKDKTSLKKPYAGLMIGRRTMWAYVSAAASIVILFILFIGTDWKLFQKKNQLALSETESSNQKTELVQKNIVPPESEKITEPGNKELISNKEKPVILKESGDNRELSNFILEHSQIETLTTEKSPRRDLIIEKTLEKLEPKGIIQVKQPVLLADLRFSREIIGEQPDKSGFLTIRQFAIREFKSKVLLEDEEKINPDRFSVWDMADAGVKGVNKLVGWNMELDKIYDEKGIITALAFNSGTLAFNTSLK